MAEQSVQPSDEARNLFMGTHWIIDGSNALQQLSDRQPLFWTNPKRDGVVTGAQRAAIQDAQARMHRFAPMLTRLFPELHGAEGRIESPLLPAAAMAAPLGFAANPSSLFVKADHSLPVCGSIKARGGAHAVLEIAERLAGNPLSSDAQALQQDFRAHEISVGSTGNLGISIGTFATALGFRAAVHMSSEAKGWKKARLRARGVRVVEHYGDYLEALASGRSAAQDDTTHHFIDDEDSETLLYGYATAAQELSRQLAAAGRVVDPQHPLFVYLPCGVGGAPAGISLGLSALYGRNVHCFYAEPVEAPCMLLALAGGDPTRSVYDLGLSGATQADGLAVPRASEFAARLSRHVAAGAFTVGDELLFQNLRLAYKTMGLRLEPSAAAGFEGAVCLSGTLGRDHLARLEFSVSTDDITHVVWTTGGALVPDDEFAGFLHRVLH
jgi:D-serine dehydratase